MNILRTINKRLADINLDSAEGPDHPIENGQKVVGKLDSESRNLWCLLRDVGDKVLALREEHSKICNPGDQLPHHNELLNELQREAIIHRVIHDIFWDDVTSKFPEPPNEDVATIGVATNWQVYWTRDAQGFTTADGARVFLVHFPG